MITILGALHPKANVDRLYIKRKDGGGGLISVEYCVGSERKTQMRIGKDMHHKEGEYLCKVCHWQRGIEKKIREKEKARFSTNDTAWPI